MQKFWTWQWKRKGKWRKLRRQVFSVSQKRMLKTVKALLTLYSAGFLLLYRVTIFKG